MKWNEWAQLACVLPIFAGFEGVWVTVLTQGHWYWVIVWAVVMCLGVKGVLYFE